MAKKIYVVHGSDGSIISASASKNPPQPKDMRGVAIGEFEVPAKFENQHMKEYIRHLSVDVQNRKLKEG